MKITIKLFGFFMFACLVACLETDRLEPDPCAEVECSDQFFCIEGNCVCPDGYKVYKGRCMEIDADDYVLSQREGDSSCLSDYHVLRKLPQAIDSLGFEDWATISFYLSKKGYGPGDTLHFQNIDSDDDEFPIRGNREREVIQDPFDSCLDQLEPSSVYILVITELYFNAQTIELTVRYLDKWTGDPLRDPVNLTFDRYGS